MPSKRCTHCGAWFSHPIAAELKRRAYCSRACFQKSRLASPKCRKLHPLYRVYANMKARCNNPRHPSYAGYGGRGIFVDPRWESDFWAFVEDVGPRPEGMEPSGRAMYSLDRIDNDGPYAPGNTRWADRVTQSNNRRPAKSRDK